MVQTIEAPSPRSLEFQDDTENDFIIFKTLLYKASVTGSNVHLCNESYTTKTCGKCGNLENMGEVRKFSHVPNVILKLTVITMEPGIFT